MGNNGKKKHVTILFIGNTAHKYIVLAHLENEFPCSNEWITVDELSGARQTLQIVALSTVYGLKPVSWFVESLDTAFASKSPTTSQPGRASAESSDAAAVNPNWVKQAVRVLQASGLSTDVHCLAPCQTRHRPLVGCWGGQLNQLVERLNK